MATLNGIPTTIETIVRKIAHQHSDAWNLDVNRWDWAAGVALWGMIKCDDAYPEGPFLEFLTGWCARNAGKGRTGSVNNVIPANAPLHVWKKTGNQACRAVADEYADWCLNRALRTSNGGWAHVWEGGSEDYRHQLWVDTVFMAGLFLARYGIECSSPRHFEEAVRQVLLHIDTLYDPTERLFRHGFHCESSKTLGEHWGRGNGWMVASLADMLTWLERDDPRRGRVLAVFRQVMERAHTLKLDDGGLRTLLNHSDSYAETTCSALFGYAALRGTATGALDDRFRTWGLQLVDTLGRKVDGAGLIAECSYGTNPESKEVYMTRPFDQSLYADGILLMLLSEADRGR